MVAKLTTLEVDIFGNVLFIAAPEESELNKTLPVLGECLLSFWDETTNNILKAYFEQVFSTPHAIELSINLDFKRVDLTAFKYSDNKAFVHCKHIETLPKTKNYPTESKDWGFEKNLNRAEDTDDQIKNQEALKISEEKYKYLFENAPYPMVMWEFKTLNILDVNKKATELYGYTKEEFTQLNIKQIRQAEDIPLIEAATKSLESYGVEHHGIWRQINKSGKVMYVEVNARVFELNGRLVSINHNQDVTKKLKVEERLKLSDYIIKNATTAIYLIMSDGTIYDFNEAAHTMLGYTKEEFEKLHQIDIDPTLNAQSIAEGFDGLRKQGTVNFQHKIVKKSGELIDVEITANFIVYDGLELNCSFLTDITGKKIAEERLLLLEKVVTETSQAVVISDATVGSDTPVIYANAAFTKITGYTFEEVKGNNPRILHRDMDTKDEIGRVIMRNAIRDFVPWKVEVINTKKNGEHYWAEVSGFPVFDKAKERCTHWIAIQIDITTRKNEEERLKLLESVIINTKDSILITEAEPFNLPGPRILYVNPAFEKMTGYKAEEVIGQTPRLLQNEDTDRKELDKLFVALNKWEAIEITVLNSRKNGEKFWNNFSMTPVANEKGWFTHWIAVERDVTKEIEAAKEKEKLLEELVQNNKELKQFSYITTHNLRAPLTNLISICNLLDTDKIEDARTVKLIEGFKTSTHHLNETLNDLIKVLIIKENVNLTIEELNFETILDNVKSSIYMKLIDSVATINADFTEAPVITFSKPYLESIFLNLFTNSVKYKHPERNPIIEVKTIRETNGQTKLTFSDNGIGMNMNSIKDRIFGLYQRFHSNTDSKGIGLYLIHSQITALGGKIEVESEVNAGTTFTITFK